MSAQAMLELPLDDDLFKVLSSDTRREILRLLVERRMTGTELATRLNLGKPAVAEHLKRLSDSDLIVRHDDPERRWVYYELSTRGRTILEPQRVRFYLVMAVAAAAVLVGVILVLGLQVLLGGSDHIGRSGMTPDVGGGDSNLQLPGNVPGAEAIPTSAAPTTTATPTVTYRQAAGDPAGEPRKVPVVYYQSTRQPSSGDAGGTFPVAPSQPSTVSLAVLNITVPPGVDPSTVQFILQPSLIDAANGTMEAVLTAVEPVADPDEGRAAASATVDGVAIVDAAPDSGATDAAQASAEHPSTSDDAADPQVPATTGDASGTPTAAGDSTGDGSAAESPVDDGPGTAATTTDDADAAGQDQAATDGPAPGDARGQEGTPDPAGETSQSGSAILDAITDRAAATPPVPDSDAAVPSDPGSAGLGPVAVAPGDLAGEAGASPQDTPVTLQPGSAHLAADGQADEQDAETRTPASTQAARPFPIATTLGLASVAMMAFVLTRVRRE